MPEDGGSVGGQEWAEGRETRVKGADKEYLWWLGSNVGFASNL